MLCYDAAFQPIVDRNEKPLAPRSNITSVTIPANMRLPSKTGSARRMAITNGSPGRKPTRA